MTVLCGCGCGESAPIARQTNTAFGHVKGMPMRFVRGHATRKSSVAYVVDDNGCWVWQRARSTGKYGHVWNGERQVKAHRHYYECANGPIPPGMVIDHTCCNKACVNPVHLEAVTQSENLRRAHARLRVALAELVSDEFRAVVGEFASDEVRAVIARLGRPA